MLFDPVELPNVDDIRKQFMDAQYNKLDVFKATDLTPAWQHAFTSGRTQAPSYTSIRTLLIYMNAVL